MGDSVAAEIRLSGCDDVKVECVPFALTLSLIGGHLRIPTSARSYLLASRFTHLFASQLLSESSSPTPRRTRTLCSTKTAIFNLFRLPESSAITPSRFPKAYRPIPPLPNELALPHRGISAKCSPDPPASPRDAFWHPHADRQLSRLHDN